MINFRSQISSLWPKSVLYGHTLLRKSTRGLGFMTGFIPYQKHCYPCQTVVQCFYLLLLTVFWMILFFLLLCNHCPISIRFLLHLAYNKLCKVWTTVITKKKKKKQQYLTVKSVHWFDGLWVSNPNSYSNL